MEDEHDEHEFHDIFAHRETATNKVEITYQFQDPTSMVALQHFSVRIEDQNIPADKLLKNAKSQLEKMLDRRDKDIKVIREYQNKGWQS